MSVNGVIASFATQGGNSDGTYPVTRTPTSTYDDNGRIVESSAPTTFNIVACVQPFDGRTLNIPRPTEHDTTSEKKLVLTETELKPRTPTTEGDRITIKNESWEVIMSAEVEHWGETHYECVAKREANS